MRGEGAQWGDRVSKQAAAAVFPQLQEVDTGAEGREGRGSWLERTALGAVWSLSWGWSTENSWPSGDAHSALFVPHLLPFVPIWSPRPTSVVHNGGITGSYNYGTIPGTTSKSCSTVVTISRIANPQHAREFCSQRAHDLEGALASSTHHLFPTPCLLSPFSILEDSWFLKQKSGPSAARARSHNWPYSTWLRGWPFNKQKQLPPQDYSPLQGLLGVI